MHATRVSVPVRVVAAVAAVAVLAAGGILAAATLVSAAPHPKPDPTKLSISNKVIAHGKHHADVVNGVLSSHATGVAKERVALEARTGVRPRWAVVATGTTGTTGGISFTVTPKAKTQYELVFAGDPTHRGSHSNVITVRPVK
jgi:hypothetical protein